MKHLPTSGFLSLVAAPVVQPTVVPEPSTVLMVATGLLMLGLVAWRRRQDDE